MPCDDYGNYHGTRSVVTQGLMGYEQAKLRGAASYVSWVVTRTLSLTTRESARRAIPMVACLMPSVCVMICGGPGAQPASSYACAHPLKGVSPLHASNRPSGWPAAAMEKKGLLPGGLPLRARARISIDPEDPTGMRSNPKMAGQPLRANGRS